MDNTITPTLIQEWVGMDSMFQPKNFPPNNLYVIVKIKDDLNQCESSKCMIAKYIPKFFEEFHGNDDWFDWCEEKQCKFIKEGWYANTVYIGDEYSSYFIDGDVTHWRMVPK